MKWDAREHMVLYVVIHVPVNKPTDWIYMYRSCIKSMVDNILSKSRMLQYPGHHMVPCAKEAW